MDFLSLNMKMAGSVCLIKCISSATLLNGYDIRYYTFSLCEMVNLLDRLAPSLAVAAAENTKTFSRFTLFPFSPICCHQNHAVYVCFFLKSTIRTSTVYFSYFPGLRNIY